VDAENIDHITPLWSACENGWLEVVKELVKACADVDRVCNYNGKKFTPQQIAKLKCDEDWVGNGEENWEGIVHFLTNYQQNKSNNSQTEDQLSFSRISNKSTKEEQRVQHEMENMILDNKKDKDEIKKLQDKVSEQRDKIRKQKNIIDGLQQLIAENALEKGRKRNRS